jgi:hypothetical protein
MLTSKDFSDVLWGIIRDSHGTPEGLQAVLSQSDKDTIVTFFNEFLRASGNLWDAQLPSCLGNASVDAKADIFDFIVAQGKEVYDEMVNNPEKLPHHVDSNDVWVKGLTSSVYWNRFGERIPRYYLEI